MKLILSLLLALVMSPFNADGREVARVEDGQKNFVIAFGDVPDTVINEVRAKYPDSHFRKIAEDEPIAGRYKPFVEFPAIVAQDYQGKVLYKKSMRQNEGKCGPFRPCPEPAPEAPPAVEPPTLH